MEESSWKIGAYVDALSNGHKMLLITKNEGMGKGREQAVIGVTAPLSSTSCPLFTRPTHFFASPPPLFNLNIELASPFRSGGADMIFVKSFTQAYTLTFRNLPEENA